MTTADMPRVLIVDDEASILKLVDFNFQRSGFVTELTSDGLDAYERIVSDPASLDIVVLDIMLPGVDGLEICKRVRQANLKVPIILLTALDEEVDRIIGLEIGADDYVTKPFSPRELVARARAVLRRMEAQPEVGVAAADGTEQPLTAGDIGMDLVKHEVRVRGELIEFTPKEFDLLQYFLENMDRVLTRDQLLDKVWGYAAVHDTRLVDVHVSHLREKLEKSARHPSYIRTVRGIGYRFSDQQK